MSKTKILLIGRHVADLPEQYQVVEQRNITFPATAAQCVPIIRQLEAEALSLDARLLLQNTPGQVAMALCEIIRSEHGYAGFGGNIGVIISHPAEALPALQRTFNFWGQCSDSLQGEATMAILHANPRARVTHETNGLTIVEVEQPRPFAFSHIEWM